MFTWGRYTQGGYEVSSGGDNRFSAFNARLKDGRSIEMHYQCDVKGYDPRGVNWRLGKGKPPINSDKDIWQAYLNLWREWVEDHPDLLEELYANASMCNYTLTDKFATTSINQAHALATLLNERYFDINPT